MVEWPALTVEGLVRRTASAMPVVARKVYGRVKKCLHASKWFEYCHPFLDEPRDRCEQNALCAYWMAAFTEKRFSGLLDGHPKLQGCSDDESIG